jgi:hypothetical protein
MRTVLVPVLLALMLAGCSSCEGEPKAPAPAARAPESDGAPVSEVPSPIEQARQQARKQMAEDAPLIHIDSPLSPAGKHPAAGAVRPAKTTRYADQALLEGARELTKMREKMHGHSVTLEKAEPAPDGGEAADKP